MSSVKYFSVVLVVPPLVFGENEKGHQFYDLVSVSKLVSFTLIISSLIFIEKAGALFEHQIGRQPKANTVGSSPTSCSKIS